MGRLATVMLLMAACTPLFARQTAIAFEPAEMVDMQQTIFSSGGTLELKDSNGAVQIFGWDQPQIEVTVTKQTLRRYAPEDMERILAELDKIVVSAEHIGNNHVVIRTEFPSHSGFGPAARAKSRVTLQYLIKVPRQTRIVVRHEVGEVKVTDVAASVDVTARSGGIEVELPGTERYDIDAVARNGNVNSDWLRGGELLERGFLPPHKVTLRVGVGDICIRKATPHWSAGELNG